MYVINYIIISSIRKFQSTVAYLGGGGGGLGVQTPPSSPNILVPRGGIIVFVNKLISLNKRSGSRILIYRMICNYHNNCLDAA